MTSLAFEDAPDIGGMPDPEAAAPEREGFNPSDLRPVPRISVQAFCETSAVAGAVEAAAEDRRMAKAHVKVHMGGIGAAGEFYASAPTPNLIMIESQSSAADLIAGLDRLAEVCDSGSKVVVVGHVNDVTLYRDLIHRGVSEYLVYPIDLFDVIGTIGALYTDPRAEPLGRTIAVAGAKGGCGASTIAHNVSFAIASQFESDVVLADLDLAFGTAGLDFNQDPLQGIYEAISSPERLDETLLDRLLAKCTDRLSLLAAPASLERAYDYDETTFDALIEVMRKGTPSVVLDLPHGWTSWTRHVLAVADEILLVAEPDLANLRNAKNMVDTLHQLRPNDNKPHLVLNRANVPKRPEIKADEFARALGLEPTAVIGFDPQLFGTAANNGQMIGEIDAKSPVSAQIDAIAQVITGRGELKRSRRLALKPLMARLLKRGAK